jgi:aspartyl/asparaginyl beta-hydroxylase (cupin superfamily)
MPSTKGTWSALWLVNKDYEVQYPSALWSSGGEIDIIEYLGEDKDAAFATAHFGKDRNNKNDSKEIVA